MGKGRRIIIPSSYGNSSKLIYVCCENSEMNATIFKEWFGNQFVNLLEELSVTAMEPFVGNKQNIYYVVQEMR